MKILNTLLILTAITLASHSVSAASVVFDLRNPLIEDLDESTSFIITSGGINATVSANTGVLNRTASGFGINGPDTGDDTDGLDTGETVSIVFDANILLTGFSVSAFGTADSGTLLTGLAPVYVISSTGFQDLGNILITAGSSIDISGVAGSFSLDSVQVETVPIPSALLLFVTGIVPLMLTGIRQRK